MLREVLMTSVALGLLLPSGVSHAVEPAPDGATMTMTFKVEIKDQSKGEFNSQSIHHVLTAHCNMIALIPSPFTWDGPTAAQEAEMAASAAQGEALSQQMAPDEAAAAQLQAEAEKCGEDEACLMALAMKLANDPAFAEQQQQAMAGAQAAATLQPSLGPARYQQWNPERCTGELRADDTYVTSDPGGEGGAGAYTDTVTVSATGPITDDSWPGLFLQVDLQDGTTTYKMIAPPPVSLPSTSSMTGSGMRDISVLSGDEFPFFGPYPGRPGGHRGNSGPITAEWSKAN